MGENSSKTIRQHHESTKMQLQHTSMAARIGKYDIISEKKNIHGKYKKIAFGMSKH